MTKLMTTDDRLTASEQMADCNIQTGDIETSAKTVDLMTDEELLLEYRETDDAGLFENLVKRYERELYNYLRRFLGSSSLAEDAFQGTFLQVHLKSHMFDASRKFRPWLYTVATNQAIDIQRRNKRHRLVSLDRPNSFQNEEIGTLMDLLESDAPKPLDEVDRKERARWVHHAVETLPEQLQSAVNMVYFRGMKYREAADELSVPVGTVKSRLHSAIKRLGEAWDENGVSSSDWAPIV